MPSHHLVLYCPLLPHLQSFPASGSFPVSRLFTSGAKVLGLIHISPSCWASLPPPPHSSRPSRSSELSSLCYALVLWFTHCSVYMSMLCSHLFHPPLPPLCLQDHALCLCLYCCPADRFISSIFLDSLYALIYSICFSLSDLLHYVQTDSRSNHITANNPILFLFIAEQYCIAYMHHFFIHSSVSGHLGCCHVLAIVNSVAMNSQ